jgi:hypothetical protein
MVARTDFLMRKITIEADELAVKYNKTKDPGLRDQWFKKVSQVPLVDSHLQQEGKKT